MNDAQLDELLLRSTGREAPLPKTFHSVVWSRIARDEQRSFAARCRSLLVSLAQPLPAAASITATVVIGLWLGAANAQPEKDPLRSYAGSISPFLHRDQP